MHAVIKTGGKQYRVRVGEVFAVEKLEGSKGDSIVFDQVLLVSDGDNAAVGAPVVENAKVSCQVLEQFKDKKIIVYKFKRRKKYRKKQGHRQQLTRLRVTDITCDGFSGKKAAAPAKEEPVGFESAATE